MYHKKFLFAVALLQLCQAAIERDLLLTPNEGVRVFGRTLFYNPRNNETHGLVPWEQTLKHVTFLTLFAEGGRSSNLSDIKEYTKFMQSMYVPMHEEYPRFGDIITIAQGRLEKPNGYRFVEGICEQQCADEVLALWRVQKIRHRDAERGFRYEMKFSVTPLDSGGVIQHKHTHNEQYFKSFIMKDDDYPDSFNALTRRSDSAKNFSHERQARIINENPHKDNALLSHLPTLNIGEYFKNVPKASSKVGYHSNTRPVFPTTYRPNYRVKFTKPSVFETPEEPKTVVTHHFHHHYFMKDAETSPHNDQHIYPNAIRVIEAPNAEHLSPQYTIKVLPPSQTTTTTAPPPPALFYMQQIPLYIQSFPTEDSTIQHLDNKPFKQSEQQFDEIRYSEPDPLYENVDTGTPRSYSEPAADEAHPQVERPSSEKLPKPDSISAQLPPPEEHEDTQVPYVDEETEKTTRQPTQTPSYILTRKTLLPKSKYFISTSTSESPLKYAAKLSLHKSRNSPRTTSEQPVLKWKPRQKLKQQITSDRPTDIEEKVITVTPSKADVTDFEVLTQKSVSKSISVKVGNYSKEIPLAIETATTVSSEVQGSTEEPTTASHA